MMWLINVNPFLINKIIILLLQKSEKKFVDVSLKKKRVAHSNTKVRVRCV